jgi:hypothetical protein
MELAVILLIIGVVVQTLRLWMAQVENETELRLHCATKVRHEQSLNKIAQALASKKMTLEINGRIIGEAENPVNVLWSDEWPEELK